MWEVNGFCFFQELGESWRSPFLDPLASVSLSGTLVGVGIHNLAHLFYLGVYGSQLSIWIVWHSWGSELVRLLRVGSWMSERVWVHIHISEVHLPVCGTCGWLVCLHLPQSSILCVCVRACPHARARVPGRTRECGCARDGRPLVCLG